MLIAPSNIEYFTGIVEDRMDPDKIGRVRVRVFGVHPPLKIQGPVNGITTSELPWMPIVQGTNSAAMSGIGGAVTGMVEGTKVYGHWLDKYHTNGIILGSIGSQHLSKPNTTQGFSDPTGQYPLYVGSDTNPLNKGGSDGEVYTTNTIQNSNLDVGINPDDTELTDVPEDPNPDYSIENMLRRDEGLRLKVYWDSEGYPTIGIGHLIMSEKTRDMDKINAALSKQINRTVSGNPGSIDMDEATSLFKADLAKMQDAIIKDVRTGPVWLKVNRSRQMALENMAFQMGVAGLSNFQRMLAAMFIGDWKSAYKEAKNSTWFNQTKGRASRVSMIILVGNMESYGVEAPARTGNSVGAALSELSNSNDPSDPWTPTDSRILFKEPQSSYKGEYPYVQTLHTEGGHVQEFDNTPGYERYRLYHPTGSYVEVAPDGRRTIKTVSDDYYMVQGDGSKLVAGNSKTNVGGDEVYYNMGDRRRQTDGNDNIFIRGNETKTVEGNGTLLVKGNVKIVIMGTADITVEQEANITVEKDTTVVVNKNADISVKEKATINAENIDVNAEKTINMNCTDININAKKTAKMDAGVLTKVSGANVQVG